MTDTVSGQVAEQGGAAAAAEHETESTNPLVTGSSESSDSPTRTTGSLDAASSSLSSLSDNTMDRQASLDSVTSVDSTYSDTSTDGSEGGSPPLSPPQSPGSPRGRPQLKHRDSFMVTVESGHQHGHFMNVHVTKEDEYVEPKHTEKHKQTLENANKRAAAMQAPPSPRTLHKQPSLLRTQSAFKMGKKRERSGRKLMFDDDTLNGSRSPKPLEKTVYASNLHYCHDFEYDDDAYSPRGRACCTVS